MLPWRAVFHCIQGGKPVNASNSITPLIGERLIDIQPKLPWIDIKWKEVEEHVNRLQTGITKAVKEQKRHLVKIGKPRKQTAARYKKGYEMLERYEGQLSRTVLRQGEASNRLILSRLTKQTPLFTRQ